MSSISIEESAATSREPDRKSILSSFIENAVLLTGLFIFIGSVYQQAYLRNLGIRTETLDLNQLVPRFTDPLVIAYIFFVWLLISRLPERWYARFAELVSPTTWRITKDGGLRLVGIALVYGALVLLNVYQIQELSYDPVTNLEYAVPPSAFLSRPLTVFFFIALGVVTISVYYWYAGIRRKQLDEVTQRNRKNMYVVLTLMVPATIIFGAMAICFVFPSAYGVFKSEIDINRMRGTTLSRVDEMNLMAPTCIMDNSNSNAQPDIEKYVFSPGELEVHYLGGYSNKILFLLFSKDQIDLRTGFKVCMVEPSLVSSMLLAK